MVTVQSPSKELLPLQAPAGGSQFEHHPEENPQGISWAAGPGLGPAKVETPAPPGDGNSPWVKMHPTA